jgi:hypothetical protein
MLCNLEEPWLNGLKGWILEIPILSFSLGGLRLNVL